MAHLVEAEQQVGGDLLSQLHPSVTIQVLRALGQPSLGAVASTSRELRSLALALVKSVKAPSTCSKKQLLEFDCAAFPAATQLVLKGEYAALRPADVDDLLRAWGHAGTAKRGAAQADGGLGPRQAWHAQPPRQQDTGREGRFTSLVLSEVLLAGPLAVSALTHTLCSQWTHLQALQLHDTRLTCPIECTEPVPLDALLRRLYTMQGKPLPHLTVLRQQVAAHEARLDANLIVTLRVFEALAQLPRLAHLDVRSRYLHVHNVAVAALGRCSALTRLTLQLPSEWPSVTEHGLALLPPSLRVLQLITPRPARTWKALVAYLGGATQAPAAAAASAPSSSIAGGMLGPLGSNGILRIATQPAAPISGGTAAKAWGATAPGLACCTNGFAPPADPWAAPQPWVCGSGAPPAPPPLPGGEAGVIGGLGAEVWLEGPLGDARWRPTTTAAAAPSAAAGDGAPPALATLSALRVLRLRSSCTERPPPEELQHVEGVLGPNGEMPDTPQEVGEARELQALLHAAPALEVLELSNAGPVLVRALTQALAAGVGASVATPQVPRRQLLLSCQSHVDACALLPLPLAARLTLTLKGITEEALEHLVQAAAAAQPPAGAPQQPGGGLAALHFQRSHELTDQALADALAGLPAVRQLTLTTCRQVTTDLVVHMARLRRPVRLRVAGCRLVSARGWEAAVLAARDVQGSALVDVRYPSEDDVGLEVAFE